MLIILFWRFYLLVTTILLFNLVSVCLFKKGKKQILKSLFFIVFWPLAIFSEQGRKYASARFNKI